MKSRSRHRPRAGAVLRPAAVALLGASGDAAKNTARPQRFLRKHGYTGRIVPINPARQRGSRRAAWPSLAEVPGEIDHAFIMAGRSSSRRARGLRRARHSGGDASSATASPTPAPKGAARQPRLVARAQRARRAPARPEQHGRDRHSRAALPLTVNAVLEMDVAAGGHDEHGLAERHHARHGAVARRGSRPGIRQARFGRQRGRPRRGRAGRAARRRPGDAVILLFLETVRDARALARGARRRTPRASRWSPTSSAARVSARRSRARTPARSPATDAAVDAYFRDCGIVRVDMLETLIEIAPLAAGRGRRTWRTRRASRS